MTTSTTDPRPDATQARPPKSIPAPVPVLPMPPGAEPDPRGLGGMMALIDGAERPLPLRRVRVRASIAGDVCRTEVHQVFANPFDADSGTLLEAVHIFPLPADGAVTEMRLVAGDLSVRAECREREAAEKTFAEARDKGHQAGLLTAESASVHSLRVTNLPPGEEIRVEIVVLERLETRDGERRWRFPTVIAPRYLPGKPTGHDGPGVLPDTDRAPDASRLQPPLRLSGGTPLDLEVTVAGPVSSLSSSLHAVRLDLDSGDLRVAPSTEATLDRDFVLSIGGSGVISPVEGPDDDGAMDTTPMDEEPNAHAWTDGTHTLVYVEPPATIDAPAMPRDAVFVLDRSGSMSGRKMDAARLALRTALRGLAPGDRFHLMAFDNQLEIFGDGLVDYDDSTLAAAEAWLADIGARGGTEMRAAMREALKGETPDGRLRTILLITDGQVWNQTELLRSVAARSADTLLFTMGIDTAVNDDLLRRMARLGGGTCELLTPRDDIEAAVARLEARFGSPTATGLRVADTSYTPARKGERTLFAGAPVSMLFEGQPKSLSITMRMETPSGPRATKARLRPLDFPLGALWARERVSALEDRWALEPEARTAIEAEIRNVALAHGIASRFTAFVAVIATTTAEGERVEFVQPVELPAEWDESFRDAMAPPQVRGATRSLRSGAIGGQPMALHESSLDGGRVYGSAPADAQGRSLRWRANESVSRLRRTAKPTSPPAESTPAAPAPAPDPSGELARTQGADGSFGGDIERTAVALLALLHLGHTVRKGLRRRVVAKAARWLREHEGGSPAARAALEALARVERGEAITADPTWAAWAPGSPEAAALARATKGRG